jgi:hypothetical protein
MQRSHGDLYKQVRGAGGDLWTSPDNIMPMWNNPALSLSITVLKAGRAPTEY